MRTMASCHGKHMKKRKGGGRKEKKEGILKYKLKKERIKKERIKKER